MSRVIQQTETYRWIDGAKENARVGRVLIAGGWFEVDAYAAAVAGILYSIELALKSGSLGVGKEEETLTAVREFLLSRDSGLR
jgi:hypothetical protein